MTEPDFDRLLDAVSEAFQDNPQDLLWSPPLAPPVVAANDNNLVWSLVPFPDDWYASC